MASLDNGYTYTQRYDGVLACTMKHGQPEGNPTIEDGSWANVWDNDDTSYIHFKNYSNGGLNTVLESFVISVEDNFYLANLKAKIWCNHKIEVYAGNSFPYSISIIASGNDTTLDIDYTFGERHNLFGIACSKDYKTTAYNVPLEVKLYSMQWKFIHPSHLYGYDGSNVVNFAKTGDFKNDLKICYKIEDGTAYWESIGLVPESSPLASKFAVRLSDGTYRLARYS